MSYCPAPALSGAGLLLLILMLVACSAPRQAMRLQATPPPGLAPALELDQVPFFPQERYQCGPAALASVLNWSGVAIEPAQLVDAIYLPGREGSLQLEILAATRRHGRVPYVLAHELDDILREVQAGNPVLVLQNLGLSWAPRWHYAVVVGYDLPRAELILRSASERRHRIGMALFEHTWRRGDYWALVVTAPPAIPVSADELSYLRSLLSFEGLGHWEIALKAYTSATQRWPNSHAAWFGLGNSHYAQGQLSAAETAFRKALELMPDFAPTLNNLAQTLSDQGRWRDAEPYALRAVDLGGEYRAAYAETLAGIRAGMDR